MVLRLTKNFWTNNMDYIECNWVLHVFSSSLVSTTSKTGECEWFRLLQSCCKESPEFGILNYFECFSNSSHWLQRCIFCPTFNDSTGFNVNIFISWLPFKICIHFYFWLCWVFVAGRGLSCSEQRLLQLWCAGFPLLASQQPPWLHSMASRRAGSVVVAQRLRQLWHTGLVGPRHVESSQTRDQIHVPCIAGWILYHRPPGSAFYLFIYFLTLL